VTGALGRPAQWFAAQQHFTMRFGLPWNVQVLFGASASRYVRRTS